MERHRGELATGPVDRVERGTVFVDLGKVEGWMPPDEQIPGEELRPGKPVTVVVLEPASSPRQARVRVSRASRSFVLRLLDAEVPEIAGGTVEVRAITREPGLRTKVAVASRQAAGKRGLLRVARTPAGPVVYDRGGRAPGRGAYLHADAGCIQLAQRRGSLGRALGAQVPEQLWADLSAAAAPT